MAPTWVLVYLKCLIIYATILTFADGLTLPNLVTQKPRLPKYTISTTPSSNASQATPTSSTASTDNGVAIYRYKNRDTDTTCILLQTDGVVEIKFKLHDLDEQADAFIPDKALVDGDCNDDSSMMSISWLGYSLVFNFEKFPGGERWYISSVVLTVSPSLPQLKGIQTHENPIKLYHREVLIPTPVGKSFECDEVDVKLETDPIDHPPAGLKGSLLLRLLRVQAFMYKGENFEPAFQCKTQKAFRDETAPLAVGSTLAIAVLLTVSGYGIYRYFKVKNVKYNTME